MNSWRATSVVGLASGYVILVIGTSISSSFETQPDTGPYRARSITIDRGFTLSRHSGHDPAAADTVEICLGVKGS
jgi:hypothetical protein